MGIDIIYPSEEEQLAAKAQIILAAALAILYGVEIAESMDKLGDYLDKQTNAAEHYHGRYVNVTFPQQMKAIEDALAYEIIGPDYDSYTYWESIAKRHADALKDFERIMFGSYCLQDFGACDRQLENTVPTIAGDAAFIEAKTGERREEKMRAEKWELMAAAMKVVNKDPDNIFKYINNAINIRQGLLNMATQGFNGALGTIGFELGSLQPRYAQAKTGATSGRQ